MLTYGNFFKQIMDDTYAALHSFDKPYMSAPHMVGQDSLWRY